jgi:asparagine synthase (glutamine-hydrolysing)
LWFDGRNARTTDLTAACRAGAPRARAPFAVCAAGPAALASSQRGGLATFPDLRLAVAFDGRIDDYRGGSMHVSGAQAIAEAYQRHGCDAGLSLVGDYVFCIWDARALRLVCVRDAMGQRPLFYAVTEHGLVFASEPQQVRLHPGVSSGVNEGMVAEYLSGQPTTLGETLWRGVRRLPPAHALIADAGGVRLHRFWALSANGDAAGQSGSDPERLYELFDTVVACRVKDARKVGVFLSGGVDSSCVTGMAHRLAQAGRSAPVSTLSIRFPNRSCDESPFIAAVVSTTGVEALSMDVAPPSAADVRLEVERYLDAPSYPNGLALDPLRRRAAALGFDVVLTGYGGDEWFGGRRPSPADLIRSRRYVAGLAAFLRERRAAGGGSSPQLARAAVASLLPAAVRRGIRQRRSRRAFDWIRQDFATRVDLHERLAAPPSPRFDTAEQARIYAVTQSAVQVIADEAEDRAAHAAGIDQRHPFCDRRIAEYGFRLRPDDRTTAAQSKVALRQALGSLLPQVVLTRTDKAEFSSTFVDALEHLGGIRLFERLACEEAGWVDGKALRDRYARMITLYRSGNGAYIPWSEGLWEVIALETWVGYALPSRDAHERSA